MQHRASAWLVAHVRRILSYWAYSTFKRCIRQVRASKNADQRRGSCALFDILTFSTAASDSLFCHRQMS